MAIETVPAPSDADIKHARAVAILEEIATLANTLDAELYHSGPVADRHADDVENQLRRLRTAICHIGLLADFGSGGGLRAGIGEWLLPPSFTEIGGERLGASA